MICLLMLGSFLKPSVASLDAPDSSSTARLEIFGWELELPLSRWERKVRCGCSWERLGIMLEKLAKSCGNSQKPNKSPSQPTPAPNILKSSIARRQPTSLD